MLTRTQAERAKLSNPKDVIGSDKLPLHLWPATATAVACLGMLEGLCKYGRSNFRAVGVRASIYYDAARRHLDAWFEGEDIDPASGIPHLGKALCCIAIIVDAEAADKLNDDRMVEGGYHELMTKLEPHVKRLKAEHADKTPRHYTIADDLREPDGSQTRDDVLPERAPTFESEHLSDEALESLRGRTAGSLVFREPIRFVDRVEVRPTPQTPIYADFAGPVRDAGGLGGEAA